MSEQVPCGKMWSSDTPRTDAAWKEQEDTAKYDIDAALAMREFARQLERDLARVTAERDRLWGHCKAMAKAWMECDLDDNDDLDTIDAAVASYLRDEEGSSPDLAEPGGGREAGPEEDRIEAAYWNFDARRSGYGQWKQAPMSERDAFKAEMRNALGAEKTRAEMRLVARGYRRDEEARDE